MEYPTQLLRKCEVFLTKILTVQEDNDIWLLHVATYLSLVIQAKTGQSVPPSLVSKFCNL